MIIEAKHSRVYHIFFRMYVRIMLLIHFRKVSFTGDYHDQKKPVLLIGNHYSWWDGFFVYYLNNKVFRKKAYVMMLYEQLNARKFLRRIGAFSIHRGDKSMADSLRYARKILNEPQNLLLIFPQGEIRSQHWHNQKFEPGWFRVLKGIDTGVQIVFMATLTDYFSHARPSLRIYFKSLPMTEDLSNAILENLYNEFLNHCIEKQEE